MGVYYKKTHKIAGINFLPRLTLAEYNNLTVKPEHWIRTDSPFDYSKTDVPKLTLTQYEDLAIKPKFWIRTDAPQSYTNISATQVDMTDSVSVYDYLADLDANQVEYSSGISVKDKIDDVGFKKLNPISAQQDLTIDYSNCIQIDKTVFVDMLITIGSSSANNRRLVSGLPETVSQDNFQFWGIEVKAYPNFSTTPIGFRVYNASNSGGIYPNTSISAGQFHIYGSYITS